VLQPTKLSDTTQDGAYCRPALSFTRRGRGLRPELLGVLFVAWSFQAVLCLPTARAEDCSAPDGTQYSNVRWVHSQKLLSELQKDMKTKSLLLSDLGGEALRLRYDLEKGRKERDVCAVYVNGKILESLFSQVKIDRAFVMRKHDLLKSKIEEANAQKKFKTELAKIAKLIKEKKMPMANKQLSLLWLRLDGKKDAWAVDAQEVPAQAQAQIEVPTPPKSAIRKHCPNYQAGQLSTEPEARALLGKLIKALEKAKLYPQDVANGEKLLALMRQAAQSRMWTPLVGASCHLLHLVADEAISLGVVMRKFHRVNRLQEKATLKSDELPAFRNKVRLATDHIAKQDYAAANQIINELLVTLGESSEMTTDITAIKTGLDKADFNQESAAPSDDN